MREYGKKNNRFFLVMLAVALSCCIITSASYSSGVSNAAAGVLGFVVAPVQNLLGSAHSFIDEKLAYFDDVDVLRDENEKLKGELAELNRKLSEMELTKKENEMLYGFLELKREREDIKFVKADIISRTTSNYTSDFTIDKGSLHGIEKNMPVVSEDSSLLGIIVEAGPTYARGKMLASYDLSIGVKNERTGEPSILSGSLELSKKNLCEVAGLLDKSDYKAGDIIKTSGLGDIYPPNLYVGTVTELVPDKYGYTVSAVVKPSSSVFDTDMVMVITDYDRLYETKEVPDEETDTKDEQ